MAVTVDQVVVRLEAQLGAYNANVANAQREFDRRMRLIETRAKGTERAVNSSLTNFLRAGIVLAAAKQLADYADTWLRVGRALQSTEQFFGVRTRSIEALAAMAIRTRSDLESISQLYNRTAIATRGLGLAEQDVADVTETVAKALKLGSASASEQSSTLLQLSQALQKGKLDGDEFRTVMENASVIQEALIKRLGITKKELYAMSQAGKIGVGDLVNALRDVKPEVDKAFGDMPATIAESFQNLQTEVTQAVGRLNAVIDISGGVVTAVNNIGEAVNNLVDAFLVLWPAIQAVNGAFDAAVAAATKFGEQQRKGPVYRQLFDDTPKNEMTGMVFGQPTGKPGSFGDDPTFGLSASGFGKSADLPGGGPGKGNGGGKSPEQKFADDIRNARKRIESLQLERATLGLTTFEITRRTVALDLEQKAIDDKIKITPKLREQIALLALETANHTAALEKETEAFERVDQAAQDSYEATRQAFSDLILEAKSFDEVLSGLLKRFAQIALDNAFQSLFAPKQGGKGGGLLGGIFNVVGSIFGGFHADGGSIGSGKIGVVGERGPELAKGPMTVFPNAKASGSGGGGPQISIQQVFDFHDLHGGDIADIKTFLTRLGPQIKNETLAAVRQAVQATPNYLASGR